MPQGSENARKSLESGGATRPSAYTFEWKLLEDAHCFSSTLEDSQRLFDLCR